MPRGSYLPLDLTSGFKPYTWRVIEVLYFEDCPHLAATVALASEVAAECGLDTEIREVPVSSGAEAVRMKFLGSPSVRVNGVDIEPEARDRTEFALSCRLYGTSGVPPKELLVAALRGLS